MDVARAAKVQAVHPGYGFLSESPSFARAVKEDGLFWIGPPPEAIEEMGDKLTARRRMREAGLPVVPGSDESASDDEALVRKGAEIGVPLLVKASGGGGGKGMSRVDRLEDLPAALDEARRIARAAFGVGSRLSRAIPREPAAHRVSGLRRPLRERRASLRARMQRPAPAPEDSGRDAEHGARPASARSDGTRGGRSGARRRVRGSGHGRVSFRRAKNFYFLEMNTRLQVEHPITEETLGLDLVRAQIQIASGEALPPAWRGGKLAPQGHAIELRLYAEDPIGFLPRSGRLRVFEPPAGPGHTGRRGRGGGKPRGRRIRPAAGQAHRLGARSHRRDRTGPSCSLGMGRPRSGDESAAPAGTRFAAVPSGRYSTDLIGGLPAPAPRSSRRGLDCRRRRLSAPPRAGGAPRRAGSPVGALGRDRDAGGRAREDS